VKKTGIIFVILLVIALGSIEAGIRARSEKTLHALPGSIVRGMAYYSANTIANLPIDSYFLYEKIIDGKNKSHPPFDTAAYAPNPFVRLLDKNVYIPSLAFSAPENNAYKINPEYEQYLTDPWDSVLLKALYCDISGYDYKDFATLESLYQGDGGYFDTHLIIGLALLERNSCYQKEEIDAALSRAAKSVIQAENSDNVFSDLYAERIVVLYWAGFGEYVRSNWIERVEDSSSDPGWGAGAPGETVNPHTTGLALLSLIYYKANVSFEPI
jgi:hypothetical protein